MTWSLILAAGASSRFGSAKALAPWGAGTLLTRAIGTARTVSGERVLVVTGGHAERVVPAAGQTAHVFNPRWAEGMGTSIACGVSRVEELDSEVAALFLLLVDQPGVEVEHLIELKRQGERHPDSCILTRAGEQVGPPAFIPRLYFSRARLLEGERGLKAALSAEQIQAIENPAAFSDIDTPEAWEGRTSRG